MRLLSVTTPRFGAIQPVRFGISAEQRRRVHSIADTYKGPIEDRKYI